MRLAEAGPWWDHAQQPTLTRTRQEQAELDGLEATLADADDRAHLQATARAQLTPWGVSTSPDRWPCWDHDADRRRS